MNTFKTLIASDVKKVTYPTNYGMAIADMTLTTFEKLFYQQKIYSFEARDQLSMWIANSGSIKTFSDSLRHTIGTALLDDISDVMILKNLLQNCLDSVLSYDTQNALVAAIDRNALSIAFFLDIYDIDYDINEFLTLPIKSLHTLKYCHDYDLAIDTISIDTDDGTFTVKFREI